MAGPVLAPTKSMRVSSPKVRSTPYLRSDRQELAGRLVLFKRWPRGAIIGNASHSCSSAQGMGALLVTTAPCAAMRRKAD